MEERLSRLERENRRLKLAGVVALAVIAAVVVMGQATGTKVAKVIEAEKFVVKDKAGNVRTILGVDLPQPKFLTGLTPPKEVYGLHFYDADGIYMAGLAEQDGGQGWGLSLYSKDTWTSAYLIVGTGSATAERGRLGKGVKKQRGMGVSS